MKRILKWTVAGIALLFVAAQLSGPPGDQSGVDPTRTIEARVHLPAEVDALLERSCMDCIRIKRAGRVTAVSPSRLRLVTDM